MGLFSKRPTKPEKLIYGSLQWDAVMFRDWPELRALPYWQRFRSDFRMRGEEGRAYVTELRSVTQMLVRRPEGVARNVPEPYRFTVVLPDGSPLTPYTGVELGELMSTVRGKLPSEIVLLRHTTGMWPMIHVDIMRNAGDPLNDVRLQLRTAAPRRQR